MRFFELLESRQLADATAPYVVTGTAGSDVISVEPQQPPVLQPLGFRLRTLRENTILNGKAVRVTVNGVTTLASLASGQRIQINGLDGSDRITVTGSRNVEINGGNGDDVITGGAGNDVVRGGAGIDVLRGGPGDDVLYADAGGDVVHGDAGDDRLYGGAGPDQLNGGDGADTIVSIGGSALDRAWGNAGYDSFWVDKAPGERIEDANFSEMAINLHYVASYALVNVNGVPAERLAWPRDPMRLGRLGSGTTNLPDPYAWDVPYRRFADRPLFNGGGPHPDDIKQQGLGDCYFLAGLSAVAKTAPNTIRQSVVDLGDGTYAVRFYDKQKVQHYYRVDADLPAWTDGNPVYAGLGIGGAMWGPILEKTWAFFRKNHGSYASIIGGWSEHTYQALGLRTTIYASTTWNTPQKMVEAIMDLKNKGNSVTFGTRQNPSVLVGLHVYSVDRVFSDFDGIAYVVLRNPWAIDGPNGDTVNDGYVTLRADVLFGAYDQVAGGRM